MKDIKRICNLIINLSKFTSNKRILNKITTNFIAKFRSSTNTLINNLFTLSIIKVVNEESGNKC